MENIVSIHLSGISHTFITQVRWETLGSTILQKRYNKSQVS